MLKQRYRGNQPQTTLLDKKRNVLFKEINAGLIQPEWLRQHATPMGVVMLLRVPLGIPRG